MFSFVFLNVMVDLCIWEIGGLYFWNKKKDFK